MEEPTMTVLERLRDLRVTEQQVRETPCAGCGHPFYDHQFFCEVVGRAARAGRCWWPRVRLGDNKPCRCKSFVDPSERLDV